MPIKRMAVLLMSMAASFAACADDAPRIPVPPDVAAAIKERGCHSCHAWTTRKFGPAWDDVADRYRGKKTYVYRGFDGSTTDEKMPLVDGLVKKVSQGGQGVWNAYTPMLPNDIDGQYKAEITSIVKFILSMPPKKKSAKR